ncbi:MAG TPA: hypothetical protein VNZ06_09545 [Steroidobacteraceae bacterium]|nr:hypothetical protein [Steroidobacteraceae bacterium]
MNGLPTGRVIRRMLGMGALLTCAGTAFSAEPAGAVAPAHGPMLMIYVSQPLMSGASRVYGLRLDQVAQIVNAPITANGFYAASPQRSLVDLQIRRRADVRLELGNRVTWNLRRREFEFPDMRPTKPIDFVAQAHQNRP